MDSRIIRKTDLSGGPLALSGLALDPISGAGGPLFIEFTGGQAQVRGQRVDLEAPQALMAVAPLSVIPLPKTAAVANVTTRAGLLTINGYTLQDGDLVLLTAQSTTTQNGLYMAHADDASGAVAWSRPALPIYSGQLFHVQAGAAAGKTYRLTTAGPITPGTTAQSYDEMSTGGGGSAFDPTNPGPIGGTTPAAGTFTDLVGTLKAGWLIGADGSPTADNTYKLGTTAYRLTEVHVKKIVGGPNTDGNGYITMMSGSDVRGVVIDTSRAMSGSGAPLAVYANGNECFFVSPDGKIGYNLSNAHPLPAGTGALLTQVSRGTVTLTAGVGEISGLTEMQALSKVMLTLKTPGGTMGAHHKVGITAGDKFTVTAVDASGTLVNTDTSVFDYLVVY